MSFIQKSSKEVIKLSPFDNTMRLLLKGALPDSWMHAEVEIEFTSINKREVKTKVKFYSLYDHSLVKVIDVNSSIMAGDALRIPGMIASYKMTLTDLDEG